MSSIYRYSIGCICVLAFLGLALAACDEVDTEVSEAATNSATAGARLASDQDKPIARYYEGELILTVSTEEARETLIESARKLMPNLGEVTFESPELEMVGNAPMLMMRGTKPDGNCELIYLQLASKEAVAAGAVPAIADAEALTGSGALYVGRTQGCSGVNCEYCTVHTQGGCSCQRAGDVGQPSWCNHSCDDC